MAYMKYLFDRTVQFIEKLTKKVPEKIIKDCSMQSFIPSHCKSYEGAGMREFMLECLCCACQVIHSLHDTPECLRAGSLILCR